jgi:hypothetical protein
MKDDIEALQRSLERATASGNTPGDGDSPADALDPETASLREAWLAFGQMLESATPHTVTSPLLLGEGTGVRAARSRTFVHRRSLPKIALLAASILVVVAATWIVGNALRQTGSGAAPEKAVAVKGSDVPSHRTRVQTPVAADEPQWDDSLDEQFAQVGWQMLCIRQNRLFRTDAFGMVEYHVEQLSEAIQADKL